MRPRGHGGHGPMGVLSQRQEIQHFNHTEDLVHLTAIC